MPKLCGGHVTEAFGIPAVVSSSSLNKESSSSHSQQQQHVIPTPYQQLPIPVTGTVIEEVTDKLVTTDTIGFFEGMPFYLMTTTSSLEKQQPQPSSQVEQLSPDMALLANPTDVQMKKAWDIGFAMAMAMKAES